MKLGGGRIACPACGGKQARVSNTRGEPGGGRKRRYKCPCGEQFSTVEVIVDMVAGRISSSSWLHRELVSRLTDDELLHEVRVRMTKNGAIE